MTLAYKYLFESWNILKTEEFFWEALSLAQREQKISQVYLRIWKYALANDICHGSLRFNCQAWKREMLVVLHVAFLTKKCNVS